MKFSPPVVSCFPLPAFDARDWESATQAFESRERAPLLQGWRETQPEFRPANVRIGWTREALWFYAELEDDDAWNSATRPNELTWTLGDVLEIFLRPLPGDPYFELHVTPQNQTLEFYFQHSGDFGAVENGQFRRDLWHFHAAQIDESSRTWRVLAGVRWEPLSGTPPEEGAGWRFSCSRYDCTRGEDEPIHSSTSPHPDLDFHRQAEWGTLVFRRGDAPHANAPQPQAPR